MNPLKILDWIENLFWGREYMEGIRNYPKAEVRSNIPTKEEIEKLSNEGGF